MKILLIQAREQKWKKQWDKKNFLRAIGKNTQVKTLNIFDKKLRAEDFKGYDAVIIGGSKYGVYDKFQNKNALYKFIRRAAKNKVPLLGICFGAQIIADALDGKVILDKTRQEFGTFWMKKTAIGKRDPLLRGLSQKFLAQCAHHDHIIRLPQKSLLLVSSARSKIQAFYIKNTKIYGVQFHPERSRRAFEEAIHYEIKKLSPSRQEIKDVSFYKMLRSLKPTSTEIILKNFLKLAPNSKKITLRSQNT